MFFWTSPTFKIHVCCCRPRQGGFHLFTQQEFREVDDVTKGGRKRCKGAAGRTEGKTDRMVASAPACPDPVVKVGKVRGQEVGGSGLFFHVDRVCVSMVRRGTSLEKKSLAHWIFFSQ